MIKEIRDAIDLIKESTGWDVAVCSLVGSRNYNLQTEDSDFDIIAFIVSPAGTDGREIDSIQINDLRKLPERLWKMYPRDMEIVFPKDGYMCREMDALLHSNRERIAKMNLPRFYEWHMRKYREYSKNLIKGTTNTQHLVTEYGYDTKQAMHAFRVLCVLQRFADTGSFERSIRFEGREREFFMDIRNGRFSFDNIRRKLDRKLEYVEERYKERYVRSETDLDMLEMIEQGIGSFVSGI